RGRQEGDGRPRGLLRRHPARDQPRRRRLDREPPVPHQQDRQERRPGAGGRLLRVRRRQVLGRVQGQVTPGGGGGSPEPPPPRPIPTTPTQDLQMTLFLQLGFQGVALGLVYGLIALGFVAVGAYVVLVLSPRMPYPLAFLGAVAITAVLALAVERTLIRGLIGRSVTVVVLATLGISTMLHNAVLMVWGVGSHDSVGPV